MVKFILEKFAEKKEMEKVSQLQKMEEFIKDNFVIMIKMEEVSRYTQMVMPILVNL